MSPDWQGCMRLDVIIPGWEWVALWSPASLFRIKLGFSPCVRFPTLLHPTICSKSPRGSRGGHCPPCVWCKQMLLGKEASSFQQECERSRGNERSMEEWMEGERERSWGGRSEKGGAGGHMKVEGEERPDQVRSLSLGSSCQGTSVLTGPRMGHCPRLSQPVHLLMSVFHKGFV